ncbi:MAG TPA: response regulator [Bacteroidales bacterium]|nr:response regulator [Bacteroidales bacterium]
MIANFDWKDKTILIAEDDYYSFMYLKEILHHSGIKMIHVENGLRAFSECIKNNQIDIVLMDVKMPVINGLESTRLIKKYKPAIKIIAQTAFAMYDDMSKCINAGCDDYITKPIKPEELILKLEKHFSGKASEQVEVKFLN